jgi:hypothetical protein
MAPEICLENSPSHSSRDTAALNTGFRMNQEKVPETFFRHTSKNGIKEDTRKREAFHIREEGGVR